MSEEIDKTLASAPSPKVLEGLVDKLGQFLHPTHYHMFTLKHALLQLYGTHCDYPLSKLSDDTLQRKLSMCNELLPIVQILDPYSIRIQLYTGILYFEKHSALKEIYRRKTKKNLAKNEVEEARKCLEQAQRILKTETDSLQGIQMNQKVAEALLDI